jgi:hypothetical protein
VIPLALLLAGGQPNLVPTRDVDIAYAIATAHGPTLQERVRWSAAQQTQRIDLPDGTWFLVDIRSHTMRAVSPVLRTVLVLPLGAGGPLPGMPAAAGYVQGGTVTVAGLDCTAWQGQGLGQGLGQGPALDQTLCLTADGVLLAARIGAQAVEAQTVSFAPIEAAVFAVPDGFRLLRPPDGSGGERPPGQPLQNP